jgi:hypothetical protein
VCVWQGWCGLVACMCGLVSEGAQSWFSAPVFLLSWIYRGFVRIVVGVCCEIWVVTWIWMVL